MSHCNFLKANKQFGSSFVCEHRREAKKVSMNRSGSFNTRNVS